MRDRETDRQTNRKRVRERGKKGRQNERQREMEMRKAVKEKGNEVCHPKVDSSAFTSMSKRHLRTRLNIDNILQFLCIETFLLIVSSL